MNVVRLALALAVFALPAIAAPPPNDDCADASLVGALPYSTTADTTLAQPGIVDDFEMLSCGPGDGPTVWYVFVPPADGEYCARTCGSDYDTVLGIRIGSCFAPGYTCNDDSCDFESETWFDGTAGVPVYMVVGAYEFSPKAARGGFLAFSVKDASVDSDGDGVFDCDDNCVDVTNTPQPDGDFDGLGDACETCTGFGGNGQDSDADGICGYSDRCPFVSNPDQADADGDFAGDVCDQCVGAGGVDLDLDGVCDDATDNCPSVGNPDQLDADGDFLGDACDGCPGFPGGGTVDGDGDAVPDACDVCPGDAEDACATLWGCIAEPFPSVDDSLLVRVNPTTGITKTVGSLGTTDCRGLAFEPGTGRLLAIARSLLDPSYFDVFEVDPGTAAITRLVTLTGASGVYTGGMAFRDDGTLFASVDLSIWTVDLTIGGGTELGFGGEYPAGLAFDGAGRLLIAASSAFLGEVDQTTGETTELPFPNEPYACPFDIDDIFGLASTGDALHMAFFCDVGSLLGTLDPSTGIVTAVGRTPENLTALTAEVCGNGTREGGEECDDGNNDAGDCCSPTCRSVAAGTVCADDGSPCTADVCDGTGLCTHDAAPAPSCIAAPAGRSTLAITGGADPRLAWKWRGSIDGFMPFGTPTTTTDITFCLADGSGSLLLSATAPSAGLCPGGASCWMFKNGGYAYRDQARDPQGVERMTLLQHQTPGRAKLKVKGRGPNLDLAALPFATPIRAWLVPEGGGCWDATYSSPRRNDAAKLKAISD